MSQPSPCGTGSDQGRVVRETRTKGRLFGPAELRAEPKDLGLHNSRIDTQRLCPGGPESGTRMEDEMSSVLVRLDLSPSGRGLPITRRCRVSHHPRIIYLNLALFADGAKAKQAYLGGCDRPRGRADSTQAP